MMKYVVGFVIDDNYDVVLIRKNRPAWQAGFLNGVGGKVEDGEHYLFAMKREFMEETGVSFDDWKYMGELREKDEDYVLHVFGGFVDSIDDLGVLSMTDEKIEVHNIKDLCTDDQILPSAMWLIHMALHEEVNQLSFTGSWLLEH